MAVGNRNVYRVHWISPRHFRQTAEKAGLPNEEVDLIFDELIGRTDLVVSEIEALAQEMRIPEPTYIPILDVLKERAQTLDS